MEKRSSDHRSIHRRSIETGQGLGQGIPTRHLVDVVFVNYVSPLSGSQGGGELNRMTG